MEAWAFESVYYLSEQPLHQSRIIPDRLTAEMLEKYMTDIDSQCFGVSKMKIFFLTQFQLIKIVYTCTLCFC